MPASDWKDNRNLDEIIAQALLAHLSDEEMMRHLFNELDEFEQARATGHLKRCLICERRLQAMSEILAPETEEWVGGVCEAFRSILPEFVRRPQEDCVRKTPELLAHLRECSACRQSYWEATPLWRSVVADKLRQAGNLIHRALAESLDLVINPAGLMAQIGFGPLASCEGPVLDPQLASGPEQSPPPAFDVDATVRKEWALADEEARCVIRLTVSGLASEQIALSCALESDLQSDVNPAGAHIEVIRDGDASPAVSSPLSYFRNDPITLSPGSWRIRLRTTSGKKTYAWEIPLNLCSAAG
jgi:uncharacterized protein with PIN domain